MTDQRRKRSRDNAAEIVTKANACTADAARIQFVEECAETCRNPCREETKREAKDEHLRVAQRREEISDHSRDTGCRKEKNVLPAADPVLKIGTRCTSAPECNDDDGKIAPRPEHREFTLR